ncbi:hypothetical protein [uncultured Brachyspira sp.]|uniref:hypothetical protein n=1 Tax=uncultured Brachyspira sp. TaxID=221953 RepID=UPI00262D6A84|nr:hypothetical protein [uncultured Brachyspira sp.]
MSKRVLRLVSILFLSSILVLSCSNANKTGSSNNDSGNSGTGGTGDGGTTQTPEGIAKYAGTWIAQFGVNKSYNVIIGTDGSVKIKDEAGETKAENVQGSGNKYTMTVQHGSAVDSSNITITFESDNSGNITDEDFGSGTISKNS